MQGLKVLKDISTNTNRIYINSVFITAGLFLLLILFIRVTRGLDLTDEMQYYGEIKGLIESGKLFSNDLFIQQSVYILFYPVFYLYHLIFGFDGLVFFGRLVMAALSIGVFLYAYRKFLVFKFSFQVACLTALSLTFAIPYHGIFAPSYNTISQVLWIIFTIRFYEWKQHSAISWGVLPIIMAFAHPTSAVMMSLLILMRLLVEREFRQAANLLLIFLCGALIATPVVFYFSSPQEYLASLTFSSGYGVGTTFFSSKSQPITLLVIYAMFGTCLLFWRRLQSVPLALLASIFIVIAIVLFSAGLVEGGYSARVIYVLSSLSAFAFVWSLTNTPNTDIKLRQRIHWLVIGLLAYATTLGVTSGNGIGQATGAFMVGLPLLLGIAVSSGATKDSGSSLLKILCVVLVFALLAEHWSRYPYREAGWWQVNQPIQSVPEFKFISTSQDRAEFIQRMKHELQPMVQGKRTLIVSEYPGFYLALGVHPETCMLYMHSLTSDKSESVLLKCLNKKKPEIVVDIFADSDIAQENSRIKNVMHNYYTQRGFNCAINSAKFNSIAKHNPEQLKYSVCM